MSNVQVQINDLSASIQALDISFTDLTSNTFVNYNQITRNTFQQSDAENAILYGIATLANETAFCGNVICSGGLGLGKTDATKASVIQNNDNYTSDVITPITLNSTNLPFQSFARQNTFLFSKQLTAGTAVNILTVNYGGSQFAEGHLWIKIEAMITASTTVDASTKSYNLYILGSKGNNSSGIFVFDEVELTSITSSTTPASLNLGATTITYPTNIVGSFTVALTQSITGTPSQSFHIIGQYTIYNTISQGDSIITSVSF